MFWRYSWLDSIPLTITMAQLMLNFWLAATWKMHNLNELVLLWILCLFLFWYNELAASHNFVHTPWFRWEWLNKLYAALNSINLGIPFSHYHYQHLNHHAYVNDRKDSNGKTKDHSSTFAYGKDDQHENVISYCVLGLFRDDCSEVFPEAKKRGELQQLYFEIIAYSLGLIIFLLSSWQYFLFFYIPIFYAGWFLGHLENYYEHFNATPEDRYANSASYYGWLYNFILCNEGYHQEHHLRAGAHWSKRPLIRQEFSQDLSNINRVILGVPPLLGFLHHR